MTTLKDKTEKEAEAVTTVLTSAFLAFLIAIFFGGLALIIVPFFLGFFHSCLAILGITLTAGILSFFILLIFSS